MPRCLDQVTLFEKHDDSNDFPVLFSRVVLEEDGIVKVCILRTATTTDHPRRWVHTNKPAKEKEVELHYAHTLKYEDEDATIEHLGDQGFRGTPELSPEYVISAIESHIERANNLRRYGIWQTQKFMYDPTNE